MRVLTVAFLISVGILESSFLRTKTGFRTNSEKRAVHRVLMSGKMPRAKTVMVPRGHHYVFISHPELVEREIRAFLKEGKRQKEKGKRLKGKR